MDVTHNQPFQVRHVDKLSAFGRSVKLLTVRYPGLGLHSARHEMLTSHDGDHKVKEEEEEEGFETVRSECMNPITDAHWQVSTSTTTITRIYLSFPKILISARLINTLHSAKLHESRATLN